MTKDQKIVITMVFVGVIILCILALLFFGVFNDMTSQKEEVELQWSQVETVLQRRNDLIPNLVETVKAYAKHEETVFNELAQARAKLQNVMTSGNGKELGEASQELTRAVNQVIAIAENYPDLKANEQFTGLRDELAGTENRIAVQRQYYNEAVNKYNTTIKKFPNVIVAKICGFEPKEYFEADETSYEAPVVNFG